MDVFEYCTKFIRKNLCWRLFLIKLQFWGPATLLKKTQTQILSCEIWKLYKNNYFEDNLWTSVSKLYLKRDSNTGAFLWFLWIIQEHLFVKDLQTTGSETPVWGSLFNKVASQVAWRNLTVLEIESITSKQPLLTWCCCFCFGLFFHFIFYFFLFQISEVFSLNSVYLVKQWKISRRNPQAHSILCSMEIRWNLQCQVVAIHVPT